MIKASNIRYSYTDIPLFEESSFIVGENEKVGLVGPNGAGKSTLFNILLKRLELDSGILDVSGSIGYVPQEVKHDVIMEQSTTIHAYVDPHNTLADFELRKMLDGVELPHLNITDSPQHLSGGQKTKLALIKALIEEPDILLLDEPTNFLDIAGKKWVMHFLSTYPKTLIIISHDLKLLDRYIDRILAINTFEKKIEEYGGNYTKYIKVKRQKEELLRRNIITEQKHLVQMKKGLQKMDRYTSEKGVRQRTQLKKRIQKIQDTLPTLPQDVKTIKFKLLQPAWVGEMPIIARYISKSYGETAVLEDVSLSIKRSERVALIGYNGAGKSTFIKILMGIITPDSGEIIKDEKIKVGYYSQEFENFDREKTIMQTVYSYTNVSESIVRPLLARFLFRGDKIFQTVGTLSGGEKTRLSIALLLLKDFNVLVLDEPTTYLDVLSQRVILDALKAYKGTMLIVSHTEEFIKELQPDKALLLPENKVEPWSNELIDRVSEV